MTAGANKGHAGANRPDRQSHEQNFFRREAVGRGDPWRGIYLNQDLNEEELTLQKALGQSVLGRRKSKCNPPPRGGGGLCLADQKEGRLQETVEAGLGRVQEAGRACKLQTGVWILF